MSTIHSTSETTAPPPQLSSTTASAKTFVHEPSGTSLLRTLILLLPASLPLVRRLQFHYRTPYSRVFASFPADTTPPPRQFTAAFCDRSRAPETETWVFSSLEAYGDAATPEDEELAAAQLYSLLQTIRDEGVPQEILPQSDANINVSEYARHNSRNEEVYPSSPSLLIIGAVGARLLPLFRRRNIPHSLAEPYMKFLFWPSSLPAQKPLLPGFAFAPEGVRLEDLDLVLSRTSIPRTARTLAIVPSVAVVKTGDENGVQPLVAWGFLSPDGSLASLHCEEEYRGRGFAKAVALKLFRERVVVNFPGSGDDGLAHSDVAEGNLGSQGVCRGLGGVYGWTCHWVRVGLENLP